MKHLLFLYFTLSYSIGIPSLVILILAFLNFRLRILIYMFLFLLLLTLQLIFLTGVEYQYANTFSWFTNYDDLINYIFISFMIITLPLVINEWFKIRRQSRINSIFAGLFLISLALILVPFFTGVLGQGRYISTLVNAKVFQGILVFTCIYVILILIKKYPAIRDAKERFFLIWSVVCLVTEFSQFFAPVFQHFPESALIHAAGYFYWNILLLKYIIGKYFLDSFVSDSVKRVVNGLKLTEREKEVLLLVTQGLPNRQIGTQLFISEDTVKTHIKNIYKKLGVNNRVQLFNLLKETKFL